MISATFPLYFVVHTNRYQMWKYHWIQCIREESSPGGHCVTWGMIPCLTSMMANLNTSWLTHCQLVEPVGWYPPTLHFMVLAPVDSYCLDPLLLRDTKGNFKKSVIPPEFISWHFRQKKTFSWHLVDSSGLKSLWDSQDKYFILSCYLPIFQANNMELVFREWNLHTRGAHF